MKFYILPFLLLTFGIAQSQTLIIWSEEQPLTVDDFQGIPEPNSAYKASSEIGISLEVNGNNEHIEWNATCRFNKDESWKADTMDFELLKHEQLHFDICELNVRKLRQKLIALKSMPDKKELEDLMNWVNTLDNEMQRKYDYETNHSIKRAKQYEWEEYVERELEKLKAYAL